MGQLVRAMGRNRFKQYPRNQHEFRQIDGFIHERQIEDFKVEKKTSKITIQTIPLEIYVKVLENWTHPVTCFVVTRLQQ